MNKAIRSTAKPPALRSNTVSEVRPRPGPGVLAPTSSIPSKPARLCRRARDSRFAVDDIRHRDEMASVCLLQPSNHFDVFFRCAQAKSIVFLDQQAIGTKSLERLCCFRFTGVDARRNLRHAPALLWIRPDQEQSFDMGYRSDMLQYEVPDVAGGDVLR